MNHWTGQNDGSILGAATDRALEWAGQDKTKLAAVGFVAFARDFDFSPIWHAREWQRITLHHPLDRPRDFTVLLDTSPDCDNVIVPDAAGMVAIVRILDANKPVIHLIGLSGILPQLRRRYNGPFPRNQLLRMREYIPADLWRKHDFPEATTCQSSKTDTDTSPSAPTSPPSI